jgi:hypothetical protein
MLALRPRTEASDDSLYAGLFTFFLYAGEHRTETLDFIIFLVCHKGMCMEALYGAFGIAFCTGAIPSESHLPL